MVAEKIKIQRQKSHFSPPKCWNSLSLSLPFAFLLITVNNDFWCCFYWLSIWGHKNVNVSPRKNTFGGLTRLDLLFSKFLLEKEERICWTTLSHQTKWEREQRPPFIWAEAPGTRVGQPWGSHFSWHEFTQFYSKSMTFKHIHIWVRSHN